MPFSENVLNLILLVFYLLGEGTLGYFYWQNRYRNEKKNIYMATLKLSCKKWLILYVTLHFTIISRLVLRSVRIFQETKNNIRIYNNLSPKNLRQARLCLAIVGPRIAPYSRGE